MVGPGVRRSDVLTVPNLISFARLLGVPLFLWLALGVRHDGWAVAVLAIGGTTDWVDGYLARRLGQVSRLGELLDPLADRLYILATLLALTVRDVVPWPFTVALLAREAVLLACCAGAAPLRIRAASRALCRQDGHLHPPRRLPNAAARPRQRVRRRVGLSQRLGAGVVGARPLLDRRDLLRRTGRRRACGRRPAGAGRAEVGSRS